jgi:hypothetical protein
MKKLLSILGAIGLVSTASTNVMAMSSNSIPRDIITNLDEIKLDRLILNISDIAQNPFDENTLIMRIFAGMLSMASDIAQTDPEKGEDLIQTSKMILSNYRSNPTDWIILGLPGQWPDEGLVDIFDVQLLYVGADALFSGILNLDVEIVNVNTDNNLSKIITEKSLNFESDPTVEQLLDKTYVVNAAANDGNENWNFDTSKVQVFDVTYNGFYLIPAAGSDYTGAVYISITSTVIENIIENISEEDVHISNVRVDAYNSTQEKTGDIEISFTPNLGRDAFIATYSTISYGVSGRTWDNSGGENKFTNVTGTTTIGQTNFTVAPINISSLSSGDLGIFSRIYDNVNAMKINFTVSYNWTGDTFKIDFHLNVFAYATAWNAEWARAESSLDIVNFKLS